MLNQQPRRDLRAVILDVDGTLVDSNDAHAHAWVEAFREHGYQPTFGVVRWLIGMGGDKVLRMVTQLREDQPVAQQILARRRSIFLKAYLPHVRPFPNAHALLSQMRTSGLRLLVASSEDKSEVEALLDSTQFSDLIEDVVSSADVQHSKPDPDLVDAALRRLELPATQVLMLGDTPYDIEAGRQIGVRTVALRSGGWNDAELSRALALYDDAADLLVHYQSSPFARVTWRDASHRPPRLSYGNRAAASAPAT